MISYLYEEIERINQYLHPIRREIDQLDELLSWPTPPQMFKRAENSYAMNKRVARTNHNSARKINWITRRRLQDNIDDMLEVRNSIVIDIAKLNEYAMQLRDHKYCTNSPKCE